MNVIAYLDCPTGISGDMFMAAFINAGLPVEYLSGELRKLDIDGYRIETGLTKKMGLSACVFDVNVESQHQHRHWSDIKRLIKKSDLSLPVKKRALLVFERLALAEARIHGVPPEDVHFHEVGAVDSIVDIVGAAVALDYFKVNRLEVSSLPLGHGWVESAHGLIPLPAPAVLALLEDVPVYGVPADVELVTPTGAALATALAHCFGGWPSMTINKIGFGAGRSDHMGRPNILRLAIGWENEAEGCVRSCLVDKSPAHHHREYHAEPNESVAADNNRQVHLEECKPHRGAVT